MRRDIHCHSIRPQGWWWALIGGGLLLLALMVLPDGPLDMIVFIAAIACLAVATFRLLLGGPVGSCIDNGKLVLYAPNPVVGQTLIVPIAPIDHILLKRRGSDEQGREECLAVMSDGTRLRIRLAQCDGIDGLMKALQTQRPVRLVDRRE